MVRIIVILYIGFISVICLNHAVLNPGNLTSLINVEYLLEHSYEEDILSFENDTDYNPASKENLPRLPGLFAISGISNSIWQPPE